MEIKNMNETHSGDGNSDVVYIGIDQSFTGCGVVVIDNNGKVVDFSLTKTKKDQYPDMFDRATVVVDNVLSMVSKYPNSFVALEGLAFGSVGNATRDLAGLQFVLVTSLRTKLQKPEQIYTPTTVKSRAVGRSKKVTKGDMINALDDDIVKLFKDAGFLKTTGLGDLADAYWIAQLCLDKNK